MAARDCHSAMHHPRTIRRAVTRSRTPATLDPCPGRQPSARAAHPRCRPGLRTETPPAARNISLSRGSSLKAPAKSDESFSSLLSRVVLWVVEFHFLEISHSSFFFTFHH
uniref:(northern house mosquito) hypothetical protein n=1 Tax=Culex pipiens TaxID=7175 RepID=A0A8D8BVH7_CULPI